MVKVDKARFLADEYSLENSREVSRAIRESNEAV